MRSYILKLVLFAISSGSAVAASGRACDKASQKNTGTRYWAYTPAGRLEENGGFAPSYEAESLPKCTDLCNGVSGCMGVNFKLVGESGECWLLDEDQVAFPYWFNVTSYPGESRSFAWKGQCRDTGAIDSLDGLPGKEMECCNIWY